MYISFACVQINFHFLIKIFIFKLMPKEEQQSDAVRSEPIFLDEHGHKFWILRCYSEKRDILLQGLVTFIIQISSGFT